MFGLTLLGHLLAIEVGTPLVYRLKDKPVDGSNPEPIFSIVSKVTKVNTSTKTDSLIFYSQLETILDTSIIPGDS